MSNSPSSIDIVSAQIVDDDLEQYAIVITLTHYTPKIAYILIISLNAFYGVAED